MLKHSGCVIVKRGPKGGYRLSKEARHITLLEIFESLEGSCRVIGCSKSGDCSRLDKCSTVGLWNGLSNVIEDYFSSKTLEDIILEYKTNSNMFHI